MRDSRGYEVVAHNKTFEQVNTGKEIFRKNGVYVMDSHIPNTTNSYLIVFFVSGSNGDEYGQFPTKAKALSKARKMASLSLNERRKFDE